MDSGIAPPLFVHTSKDTTPDSLLNFIPKSHPVQLSSHVADIHYFPDQGQLLFRVFHGIMDGKGTLQFVKNVFKVLQGKEALQPNNSSLTDSEFVASLSGKGKGKRMKIEFDCEHPFKQKASGRFQPAVKLVELDIIHDSLLPVICSALHQSFSSSHTRWMIPVDLRRHDKKIMNDSNLSLPLFLSINASQTLADIKGDYLMALKNNDELSLSNALIPGISVAPPFLVKGIFHGLNQLQKLKRRFPLSGIVSFIEKYQLENFSAPGFHASKVLALPCVQPFTQLTLMVSSNSEKVHIAIGYYRDVWSENEIQELIDTFKNNWNKIRA